MYGCSLPGMPQWVLPDRQHGHRFDGTLQDSQGKSKLSGLTAHLNCFDPIGSTKETKKILNILQPLSLLWVLLLSGYVWFCVHSLYLLLAQFWRFFYFSTNPDKFTFNFTENLSTKTNWHFVWLKQN